MKHVRLLAVAAILLAAVVLVQGQDGPAVSSERTYAPVFRFTAGELLTYSSKGIVTMQMTPESGNLQLPAFETQGTAKIMLETLRVKPDGTGVVRYSIGHFVAQMKGRTMRMPAIPASTLEIDSRGRSKMLNASRRMADATMGPYTGTLPDGLAQSVILPAQPVRIGETWEAEIEVHGKKAKARHKLVAVDRIGGSEALRIEQAVEVPIDHMVGASGQPTTKKSAAIAEVKGTMTIQSVYHNLERNGRLLRSRNEMTLDTVNEMKGEAAAVSPFGSKVAVKMIASTDTYLVSVTRVSQKAPRRTAAGTKKAASKRK